MEQKMEKFFYKIIYLLIFTILSSSIVVNLAYSNDSNSCPKNFNSALRNNNLTCIKDDKDDTGFCQFKDYKIFCSYYKDETLHKQTGYSSITDDEIIYNGECIEYTESGRPFLYELYDNGTRILFKKYKDGLLAEEYNHKDKKYERYFISHFNHQYEKKCPKNIGGISAEVEKGKAKLLKHDASESIFIKDGYRCSYWVSLPFHQYEKPFQEYGLLSAQSEVDKNGILNGESRKYYYGKLGSISIFKNGKIDGLAKEFDTETGKLKRTAQFKDGTMLETSHFHDNGIVGVKILMKNEKEPSELSAYRDNGDLMLKVIYKDGYPESGICYTKENSTRNMNEAELEEFRAPHKIEDCDK